MLLVLGRRLANIIPTMLALAYILSRISGPGFAKLQEELSELNGFSEESLSGERETFDYGYGEEFQTTLTAGDYMIESEKKASGEKKLTPVAIKAGERMEVTIN